MEKQKKELNPAAAFLFTYTLIFVLIGGCGLIKRGQKERAIVPKQVVESQPIVPKVQTQIITKHDTVRVKPNEVEMQAIYKENYELFFAPEFNRLTMAVGTLTRNNTDLLALIKNMRERSIKRTDSMNNVHANDKKEYDKLEMLYFNEQKKQVARNAEQINNLKQITNILLAIGVLMILTLIGLTIFVRYQAKKVNKLYQSIAHG